MIMRGITDSSNYVVSTTYNNKLQCATGESFDNAFEEVNLQDGEDTFELKREEDSVFIDNGVKSAILFSRIDSQSTKHEENESTTIRINLTEEDTQLWCNGGPEGIRFVNAGGGTYGGTDWHLEYQCSAHYDTNSSDDAPVMYVFEYNVNDPILNEPILLKIDVNKVDPANATYEEMIALAGYIYRDNPDAASKACDAIDMAREYMKHDGLYCHSGNHDFTSYYLPEVVRRNINYPNPSNQATAKAAEALLEYLRDYPRGSEM